MGKTPQGSIDSDDLAQGPFRPHGRSIVWPDDDIFRVQTVGPFNAEAVEAIGRTREKVLEEHPPVRNYAFINSWQGSVMMSDAVLEVYSETLKASYTHRYRRPSAMAWVVPAGVEGARFMEPRLRAVFDAYGIPFRMFLDEARADSWVRELLGH